MFLFTVSALDTSVFTHTVKMTSSQHTCTHSHAHTYTHMHTLPPAQAPYTLPECVDEGINKSKSKPGVCFKQWIQDAAPKQSQYHIHPIFQAVSKWS